MARQFPIPASIFREAWGRFSERSGRAVATEWGAYRGTWSGWLDEADAVAGQEDIPADRFKFKSST